MDDPALSDEHPPYWSKYEEMGFAELKRLIYDSVERLTRPSVATNEELPDSQEELLALCDLLRAKAEAHKEFTKMPQRPLYDGPARPWSFTPSDELAELYRKQEEAQDRLEDEIRYGESTPNYLEFLQRQLEKVNQEITPIERREKQEYNNDVRAYREANEEYDRRFRRWLAQREKEKRRRDAEANRERAVRLMYEKVKLAFNPKRAPDPKHIGTLPFEVAAPGERTDDHIRAYYREVQSRGGFDGVFSLERLDKMLALPRSGWRRGTGGKYGYIVLMFAHTDKVILESPYYPNAIYVLDSPEERLLKMDKQELIASDEVKRLFHSGDWYRRVREALEIE